MWYLIVGIIYTIIDSVVVWYCLATGPIYKSFIYVLWPGKIGEKIFINFRDPASYGWLMMYFLVQLCTNILWPVKILFIIVGFFYGLITGKNMLNLNNVDVFGI